MMETLQEIWNYFLSVTGATIVQLFILLGPIILLASIMNIVARQNEKLSYQVFGRKFYLYVFGWLGTSIHELGHAIFAFIFAHKVTEVKLFSPKSGNTLGHVKHSYRKGNPYQTLGNFFIGLGPILLGSVLLFLVSRLLFHLDIFAIADHNNLVINVQHLNNLDVLANTITKFGDGVSQVFEQIFLSANSSWWKMFIFIYLFYSIGSSITLSNSDIKGAFRGFIYFVIILLLFNAFTIWMGDFTSDFFMRINRILSGFYFLIVVSLCLNIVFILMLLLLRKIRSILTP